MAIDTQEEKDKIVRAAGGIPEDDGADHLRADILGSIVGSDPRLPNYLGRINNLITAHGAVGNTEMKSPSPSMAVPGGDPGTASSAPPTATALPDTSAPLMGAKPKPSLLGRIGHVAARMGNIAGDIFAPGITELIPGTDLNKRLEANRAEATRREKEKESLEERRVGVEEEKERREAEAAGQPKPKEEEWKEFSGYEGPNGEPLEIEKNSGNVRSAVSQLAVKTMNRVEKEQKEPNAVEGVRRDLLDAMRSGDKAKIAALGSQLEKLSDPTGEKEAMRALQMELARQRVQEKNVKDAALTPQAQEILMNTEPTLQQVDQLLAELEPMKKDNTSRLTMSRIGYALGNASPEGSLASDISKLELDRVIAGARVLKGSSRAYQALELAMKHAPNSWIDTPNLMYDKLKNIRQNLADVIEDAKKFGTKNLPASAKTGTEKTGGKISEEKTAVHNFTFNGKQYANVPDDIYKKYKGKPGFKE